MSERETTTDLVKRLEAGETGREMDAIIWYTMVEKPGPGEKIDQDMIDRWPAYTTSLDAAVALVERVLPGAWIQIDGPRKYLEIPTPVPNRWRGVVEPWDGKSERIGWGSTPAAALIAALLKAKGAGDE